jgi:hypothetical protein
MPRRPPPRPRTGPRSEAAVLVRLSDEECAELRRAALREDRPLGAWIRLVALRIARGA